MGVVLLSAAMRFLVAAAGLLGHALLGHGAAAPPLLTVGCAPCNAADHLQDFVLTAAGELRKISTKTAAMANRRAVKLMTGLAFL